MNYYLWVGTSAHCLHSSLRISNLPKPPLATAAPIPSGTRLCSFLVSLLCSDPRFLLSLFKQGLALTPSLASFSERPAQGSPAGSQEDSCKVGTLPVSSPVGTVSFHAQPFKSPSLITCSRLAAFPYLAWHNVHGLDWPLAD